jgi:large repetitive protein
MGSSARGWDVSGLACARAREGKRWAFRRRGAPDGVAMIDTATGTLLDALSYEGDIASATIGGQVYDLVEGTALGASIADSNTVAGSLSRLPDG